MLKVVFPSYALATVTFKGLGLTVQFEADPAMGTEVLLLKLKPLL